MANMNIKYTVASRRMESKTLGMPGYLFVLDLLAVVAIIKNARTSTTQRRGRGELELQRWCHIGSQEVGAYRKQLPD